MFDNITFSPSMGYIQLWSIMLFEITNLVALMIVYR